MRQHRWLVVLVGLCAVLAASAGARADETAVAAAPAGQDRVDEMMGRYNLHPAFEKLGRGASNFLGGWLEIPLNIQTHHSNSDTAGSLFTGLAHGVLKGLVRTGVGAYEMVTFFLPYPENFAPILPTLPYYRQTGRREPLLLE